MKICQVFILALPQCHLHALCFDIVIAMTAVRDKRLLSSHILRNHAHVVFKQRIVEHLIIVLKGYKFP